jgi:hypothetical protein
MDVPSNTFLMETDPKNRGEIIFFMNTTGSGISQLLQLSSLSEPIATNSYTTMVSGIRMVFMIYKLIHKSVTTSLTFRRSPKKRKPLKNSSSPSFKHQEL